MPKIGNSLEYLVQDAVKKVNNIASKSVDHPRKGTIPIATSAGNEGLTMALNTESSEALTVFDTDKWKKIINGNVEIIQKKVDQSTPHHVLYRELDDLKMIVSNCFDQLSKSIGR